MSDMSVGAPVPKRAKFFNKNGEALAGWLMAAPVIVLLTVFVIVPFFFAICLYFYLSSNLI